MATTFWRFERGAEGVEEGDCVAALWREDRRDRDQCCIVVERSGMLGMGAMIVLW